LGDLLRAAVGQCSGPNLLLPRASRQPQDLEPPGTTPDKPSLAITYVTSLIFAPPSVQAEHQSAHTIYQLVQCAQTDGGIVPCRSALRKVSVGVKPYLRWESPVSLWRWQAARQHQSAKRRRTSRRPHRVTRSFLARRKSPTSAWRRSIFTCAGPTGYWSVVTRRSLRVSFP